VLDLAVAIALRGDCRSDLAVVRAQPQLFRSVTSGPTVSRLISSLTGDAATVGVPSEGCIHGFTAGALLDRGSGARPVVARSSRTPPSASATALRGRCARAFCATGVLTHQGARLVSAGSLAVQCGAITAAVVQPRLYELVPAVRAFAVATGVLMLTAAALPATARSAPWEAGVTRRHP
jgi:hypothetical protein